MRRDEPAFFIKRLPAKIGFHLFGGVGGCQQSGHGLLAKRPQKAIACAEVESATKAVRVDVSRTTHNQGQLGVLFTELPEDPECIVTVQIHYHQVWAVTPAGLQNGFGRAGKLEAALGTHGWNSSWLRQNQDSGLL
jgi:hypothetical protein